MRYFVALIVSGICWFCLAGLLGQSVPIIGAMWPEHLISAVVTSLVIGYLFKRPLINWQNLRWYMLPFLTIFFAAALFGLLLPLSWSVTATIRKTGNVEGEAFYWMPSMFVLYSMTVYLLVLYPLALLTQTLLRKFSAMPNKRWQRTRD